MQNILDQNLDMATALLAGEKLKELILPGSSQDERGGVTGRPPGAAQTGAALRPRCHHRDGHHPHPAGHPRLHKELCRGVHLLLHTTQLHQGPGTVCKRLLLDRAARC
ncbi:hypothetical protein OYC64_009911 [Pagothenia borchgrevinki]|uniref:Uncharacterized protein n=1 Tax=Pagothenia borchgrevinki TaxID=8213 RepID=A0ABD2H7E4_PAGBO